MKEECGIFGVFLKKEISNTIINHLFIGLLSLQHRGQEASGIAIVNNSNYSNCINDNTINDIIRNSKYEKCNNSQEKLLDRKLKNEKKQNTKIIVYKRSGVVNNLINLKKFDNIKSNIGIGQVRYSTKGSSSIINAQPILINYFNESFAIAHNGNIENSDEISKSFMQKGALFLTNSDTELFAHVLIKKFKKPPSKWESEEIGRTIFKNILPAYSLLLLFEDRIIAIRDLYGIRPLFIYENEMGIFFSSEDSSFKFLQKGKPDINKIREVEPGEIIEVKNGIVKSFKTKSFKIYRKEKVFPLFQDYKILLKSKLTKSLLNDINLIFFKNTKENLNGKYKHNSIDRENKQDFDINRNCNIENNFDYNNQIDFEEIRKNIVINVFKDNREKFTYLKRFCFFELIYFARPDSNFCGYNTSKVREILGKMAYKENPVKADIVIPVMDSGLPAAIGYSKESGQQLEIGLIKNKYIGRSFIAPDQGQRSDMVFKKLSPIPAIIENKDIVLVDDSVVRGTTMKKIVSLLKNYGANKVHVRIASPKVINSCFWGIDIPDKTKLIAFKNNEDEIAKLIGADSIGYVSVESIKNYLKENYLNFCFHCFQNY